MFTMCRTNLSMTLFLAQGLKAHEVKCILHITIEYDREIERENLGVEFEPEGMYARFFMQASRIPKHGKPNTSLYYTTSSSLRKTMKNGLLQQRDALRKSTLCHTFTLAILWLVSVNLSVKPRTSRSVRNRFRQHGSSESWNPAGSCCGRAID